MSKNDNKKKIKGRKEKESENIQSGSPTKLTERKPPIQRRDRRRGTVNKFYESDVKKYKKGESLRLISDLSIDGTL